MRAPQLVGGADAFVGTSRGHADVGDDHIGGVLLDALEERRQVGSDTDELEVALSGEEATHAVAQQDVVLGQHDPDRHGEKP